ncbi:hypothetical protein FO519_006321 [Halicephalobus sp. NKZ332]|nr:hypothetical protein FO519_006321 [Halicephalobus sp. NKZ332]
MDNIFGEGQRHLKLTYMDLSDNGIRSFYPDTFFGVPRVEYLYLRNNELESVGEKPFNYLPALKFLDLSAAFGNHISSGKRSEILKKILNSDHNFKSLEEIIISNNDFQKIDPSIFCHLKKLTRLILSGNQLESFPIKENCLENLKVLDLRSNKFSTIPSLLWNSLESLDTLDISSNPLQCDCKLQPLVKFANEDPNIFLNQQQTVCSPSSKFSGKSIFSIENENLCQKSSSFFQWFILLLIAGGFLFIYRHLRNSGRFSGFPYSFGYSQLKRNDEANPSPAFV